MTIVSSQFLYDSLYRFGFAAGILYLILFGIQRKYSASRWLLLIALSMGLTLMGSRLGAWDINQWQYFLSTGNPGEWARRSAIGGFFGLLIAFLAGRKWLGINTEALDGFAIFLPLLMFFQRLGCLFGACCFGLPTTWPFGIQYEGLTFIHKHQVSSGWIGSSTPETLTVHPVPLYMAGISILTILLVIVFRKRLIRPGQKLLFSLFCLIIGRFFVEFFRDPVSNVPFGEVAAGLKIIQWILIGGFIALTLLWKLVYSVPQLDTAENSKNSKSHFIPAWYFGVILFVFLTRSFFRGPEIFTIHLILGLSLLAWLIQLFRQVNRPAFQLSPVILVGLGMVFMSQTYYHGVPEDSNGNRTILKASGAYRDLNVTQYPCLESGQGCMGPVCLLADSTKPMGPSYMSYSIGIDRYKDLRMKSDLNYGAEGQFEHYYNSEKGYSGFRSNIHPYIGLEGKRFAGFRVGVRLGSMFANGIENNGNVAVLPTARFWFGDKDFATFQVSVFDSEMLGPYASMGEIRLNTNWYGLSHGKIRQGALALGMNENTAHAYTQVECYLNKQVALTPRLGVVWGGQTQNYWSTGGMTAGLGLRIDLQPH